MMSRTQRANEWSDLRHPWPERGSVLIRPTWLLQGSDSPPPSAARSRWELQRLLDEPLTMPLGSMQLIAAGALSSERARAPRDADSELTPVLVRARQTRSQVAAASSHTSEVDALARTRPGSTRAVRGAQARAGSPWQPARQATALPLPSTPQPASVLGHRTPEARAGVRPPPSAASPPWHPHARVPARTAQPSAAGRGHTRAARPGGLAHHRASAHGAWTWPVALSLCSMLLAYALTARMLSRAAVEHSMQPVSDRP